LISWGKGEGEEEEEEEEEKEEEKEDEGGKRVLSLFCRLHLSFSPSAFAGPP